MNFKEFNAGNVNQIKNGEMKSVKVDDDNKILLTKVENKIFAIGANCTHYGAPLEDGVLFEDKIICPWHHACFNAKNGDLLEPPALNSLPNYSVKIENEDIIVMLPSKMEDSRIPSVAKRDTENLNTNVIIGGGAAGNAAAQAMREAGFTGGIAMITQENRIPYDRPNLSKDYLAGEAEEEWMPLRPKEFYANLNINIAYQEKVVGIDKEKKEVLLENGDKVRFEKLLIATGGTPVKLDIPGKNLSNIFYLRSHDNCDEIIEAANNKSKIVIIGSSFIAMEAASSLKKRLDADITVISKAEIPFKNVLGDEIGKMIQSTHEENGIKFKLNSKVKKFEGEAKIEKIILENGESLEADLAIIGIGVKPATSFLNNFNLEKDKSISVNKYFEVEENIYAAGDIATFYNSTQNTEMRIEHWRTAEQHGRIAGFNMAGKKIEYKSVPFFWTQQKGIKLRYVGHATEWDEIITWGNIDSKDFISFYYKGDNLLAAASINHDKEMDAIEALMVMKKIPSKQEIKNKSVSLLELIK